jgi:O-acetyl-ADP-ribose deacetylase
MNRIEIITGDITTLEVEAIVNAANNSLLGGGGVDGAIHRAAGLELLAECRTLNGCETGGAKITKGYCLPANFVIHTVGPVWRGGHKNENELLARCYQNCLALAVANNLKSIAFPSISTGAYGFPIQQASKIALREIAVFLNNHKDFEKILVVCFSLNDYNVYRQRLAENNAVG